MVQILFGFMQFCSKSNDIFSARCSGESVGMSSIVNAVLYSFFNNRFIHNQNVFETLEADTHPLTKDLLNFSSCSAASWITVIPIPIKPVTDATKKKAENGRKTDTIKSPDFDNSVFKTRRMIPEMAIKKLR
ncbi:hypothetical protein L6452_42049 [Arctium lappa]|uniref:Uncharacterized protein n=1 Tax=Arctium lappa TaxID=4217 RepID=A0ACB8XID1_ARCLA|nr:hypothetical protein L6452_42049 [Arctium lappa]